MPADTRRPENLALLYQEVLTAIVRLRANRQGVNDAQAFRFQMRSAMETASAQALAAGYPAEDVKSATFAIVAFLDESVLNSGNPVFADWMRKPLQEELFGTHMAGELFYRNLQQLLGRNDSSDLADLLEVFCLAMLLGFGGRYLGGSGERVQALQQTNEKIKRIRGGFGPLAPAWALPQESLPALGDPWVRRLRLAAVISAGLMVVLFVLAKIALQSGLGVGA